MSQVPAFFGGRDGAEAKIELIDWHGTRAIRKLRIRKNYRAESLDRRLRERRTREETFALHQAKIAGVNCPNVLFSDPGASEIVMEYVEGVHLFDHELIRRKYGNALELYELLGQYIAMLHSKKLIHGDLTTKNVILGGNKLYLIDFGLSFISERDEDMGEDLHLLKQVLKSTNETSFSRRAFSSAVCGYMSLIGSRKGREILDKIAEIERRGRYARVD